MQIQNADGTFTTVDQVISHFPYPCPPSGHKDISCEAAWERFAARTGKRITRQEPTHEK